MLVALVGPACSGKLEVAKYLVVHHNFRPAFIRTQNSGYQKQRYDELVSLSWGTTNTKDECLVTFESAHALLDHATFNWRDNIVTMDLINLQDIEIGFDKRPFFHLLGIDAPVFKRWQRFNERSPTSPLTLDAFVLSDDQALYGSSERGSPSSLPMTPSTSQSASVLTAENNQEQLSVKSSTSVTHQVVLPNGLLASRAPPSTLRQLMAACSLVVYNGYATLSALHSHLSSLSLVSPHRLRPSWDTYFLSLCTLASLRSNCMKRRVGAVLVRNNRVLSTGYNGTPRGLVNCADGGCSRCNGAAAGGTALSECLCLHAEENALLECGRERGGADGTVLYCNTCPCLRCAVKIVQTGVREVVYQLAYSMDDRSRKIFQDANVLFRQYQPV